jgi:hypothetical protein
MAKAKKKRPTKKATDAAPITLPGRKFAVLRAVTLPVLALKIEEPANVTFHREEMRGADEVGGEGLARVTDLDTGKPADLRVSEALRKLLLASYPEAAYLGKSFCIIRHAKHERKNEYGYTVEEIDPNQPAAETT